MSGTRAPARTASPDIPRPTSRALPARSAPAFSSSSIAETDRMITSAFSPALSLFCTAPTVSNVASTLWPVARVKAGASFRKVPSTGPAPSTVRSAARACATAKPKDIAIRIETALWRMMALLALGLSRLSPKPWRKERAHAEKPGGAGLFSVLTSRPTPPVSACVAGQRYPYLMQAAEQPHQDDDRNRNPDQPEK